MWPWECVCCGNCQFPHPPWLGNQCPGGSRKESPRENVLAAGEGGTFLVDSILWGARPGQVRGILLVGPYVWTKAEDSQLKWCLSARHVILSRKNQGFFAMLLKEILANLQKYYVWSAGATGHRADLSWPRRSGRWRAGGGQARGIAIITEAAVHEMQVHLSLPMDVLSTCKSRKKCRITENSDHQRLERY